MAELKITRHEFVNSVHALIGENLKVQARPVIDEHGAIKAKATLEVGDIDTNVEELADKLGFEPYPPEADVIDGNTLTADDEDDDDATE